MLHLGIQMVLVGNKSDLFEFQEVPTEDVKKFAEEKKKDVVKLGAPVKKEQKRSKC